MKILTLDLGKFNTMCCYFDTKTRKHEFINATTDRDYLTKVFKTYPADLVVMEACGPSGWINDLAQSLKLKTLVCSTNEDAWSWSNVKRKTDKDDALKLARMAAMNELKAIHMPLCMGLTSIQPMGQGSLRSNLRQAEDSQEEGCNRTCSQDRRAGLGNAPRRKRLVTRTHDRSHRIVWQNESRAQREAQRDGS